MRRFIFWLLLFATLMSAGAYVVSIKYALMVQTRSGYDFEIVGGICTLERVGASAAPYMTVQSHGWGHRRATFGGTLNPIAFRIPLYFPLSLTAALTLLTGWPRRKCAPLECQRCGYDLRGHPRAKTIRCPECGTFKKRSASGTV